MSPIWIQLKLEAKDGKKHKTDCVNTKGAFRLIQPIPSAKAEPFKQWLTQVGKERLDEIENPELAQDRMSYSFISATNMNRVYRVNNTTTKYS